MLLSGIAFAVCIVHISNLNIVPSTLQPNAAPYNAVAIVWIVCAQCVQCSARTHSHRHVNMLAYMHAYIYSRRKKNQQHMRTYTDARNRSVCHRHAHTHQHKAAAYVHSPPLIRFPIIFKVKIQFIFNEKSYTKKKNTAAVVSQPRIEDFRWFFLFFASSFCLLWPFLCLFELQRIPILLWSVFFVRATNCTST